MINNIKKEQIEELLTYDEVKDRFKIAKVTLREWVRKGKLPVVYLGSRTVRFRPSDVHKFIEQGLEQKK